MGKLCTEDERLPHNPAFIRHPSPRANLTFRVIDIYKDKVTGNEPLLQFISVNSTTATASSEILLQLLYDL
jgi:hypothetical protein